MFRERQRVFASLALHSAEAVVVSGDAGAERLPGELAGAELFAMLGASPIVGRTYTEAEDRVGGPSDVVVLSEDFWRSRFGGRRDVVGQTLAIGGRKRTIVGVMPASF